MAQEYRTRDLDLQRGPASSQVHTLAASLVHSVTQNPRAGEEGEAQALKSH